MNKFKYMVAQKHFNNLPSMNGNCHECILICVMRLLDMLYFNILCGVYKILKSHIGLQNLNTLLSMCPNC